MSILRNLPKPTFWRIVLLFVLAGGLYSTYLRFFHGLGASTNLSDQFPWGLWIGFDVLCGVALAAGGFTISAAVYIFHIERMRPIVRPAILTAFLGYMLVIVGLLFDLGRSLRIWHPLVMWNPDSVMFEVGWCVTLYSTVLALEFSPLVLEKLGWKTPLRVVHSIMLPLVILGILLSTLHQSSLGSLYLIVPGKLHALWYSSWLPVFFFISALALGCAMTIFESFLSARAFGKKLELDILQDLGKVTAVILGLYLVLRVHDLVYRGAWSEVWAATYEARLFQAEMLLGVIAPILFLLIPAVRRVEVGLFASAVMVVAGFLMNRLNVSITALEGSAGQTYLPSWPEVFVTLSLVGLGFLLFTLAVKYLNVFPEAEESEKVAVESELPAPFLLRQPGFSTSRLILMACCFTFLLVFFLAASGVAEESLPDSPPSEQTLSEIEEGHSPSLPQLRALPTD